MARKRKINNVRLIVVVVTTHFDRFGNTYHSGYMHVDKTIMPIPFAYGTMSHVEQTVAKDLLRAVVDDLPEHFYWSDIRKNNGPRVYFHEVEVNAEKRMLKIKD